MLKAIVDLVSTSKNKVGNHSKETRRNITDFYYKNSIIVSLNWNSKKIMYNDVSSNPAVQRAVADYQEYFAKLFPDFEHNTISNN